LLLKNVIKNLISLVSSYKMARGGRGVRAGNDNFLAMIAGGVAATLLDFFWISNKFTGYNQKIGTVGSTATGRRVPISVADYAQLGFSTLLGTYGFLRAGSGSRIPAFSFGMAVTQVMTKFILPTANVARYIVYDIDDNGNLVTRLNR
jgi:hypothetical protein